MKDDNIKKAQHFTNSRNIFLNAKRSSFLPEFNNLVAGDQLVGYRVDAEGGWNDEL